MKKGFSDDTFLARWLAGHLKADEKQDFEQGEDFSEFENIVHAVEQMELPPFSEEESWQKLLAKKQLAKPTPLHKKLSWKTFAAAASITLIIGFGLALLLSQQNISTGNGQKMALLLPDQSEVQLNANSQVSYNKLIWQFRRQLSMQGEAFFEVREGATFKVKTPSGTVSVLGTSFNVWARDEQLEVNCHSGRVLVHSFNQETSLQAGDKVMASEGNLLQKTSLLLDQAPSWIKGESKFEETPISRIIAELERQFEIEILYEGDPGKRLTLSFPHNNLDAALRLFCGALNATFELRPNKSVVINPKE